MKRWMRVATATTVVLAGASGGGCAARGPVLGLEIGMTRRLALERTGILAGEELEETREAEHEAGGREAPGAEAPAGQEFEEVWMLRSNPAYSTVTVRFGPDHRLQSATAFTRAGGQRVRFRDLASPGRARTAGDSLMEWSVPARGRRSGYLVTARSSGPGSDSVLSVSLAPWSGGDGGSGPRTETP